jgi:hypothetical protein
MENNDCFAFLQVEGFGACYAASNSGKADGKAEGGSGFLSFPRLGRDEAERCQSRPRLLYIPTSFHPSGKA